MQFLQVKHNAKSLENMEIDESVMELPGEMMTSTPNTSLIEPKPTNSEIKRRIEELPIYFKGEHSFLEEQL